MAPGSTASGQPGAPVDSGPQRAPVAGGPQRAPVTRLAAAAGALALLVLGSMVVALLVLVVRAGNGELPAPTGRAVGAELAYRDVRPAPPLDLTDQDGRSFGLASLRGRPVLVFFGYTHCPDVCPTTVGVINEALGQTTPGPRVVFVTVDPGRDDAAAMRSYIRYLPAVYTGLTGSPEAIRVAADGWGVRYARVDEGSPDGYAMSHTADVFLVDAQGRLRAHFPFGTGSASIASALALLLAETPAPTDAPLAPAATGATQPASDSSAPAASPPTPAAAPPSAPAAAPASPATSAPASPATLGGPAGPLHVTVSSTSVWAGGGTPVAMTIADDRGTTLDGTSPVVARVIDAAGHQVGGDAPAIAIRPTGETGVSFVATVDLPSPGPWRVDLVAADGAAGSVTLNALDPGRTAALGAPAPDIHTPTLADVGGTLLAVSTLPHADSRFYEASTSDARAAGRPYVLVIDSARFKVTQVCGSALAMAFYLLDRWPDVSFVHLEPFEYRIVTGEPVLDGDISDPPLGPNARAFGLGEDPWPATNMPWVFVVDGNGIVRAKYNGIVGSRDVDLILSLITGEGVIGR
jgi:protein SCO1/2